MEYRTLGGSGLKVSPLCLGTMMFGKGADEAEAGRIVGSARDAGINFIDTAVSYAGGRGEAILGDLLASDRDWWVLATKVGSRTGDAPNEDGTNRRQVRALLVNGLGATAQLDLYILYRAARRALERAGNSVRRSMVGEFITSLEMAGASISVTLLDEELRDLLDDPARAARFHR